VKITANFDSDEFACHDGTPVPDALVPNLRRLCEALEVVRAELGHPIIIVSGYRSPAYNGKVGGAAKSEHCNATAADIAAHPLAPKDVRDAILRLILAGKIPEGGVGTYAGWVHYDVRGHKARWDARKGVRG
jgi:uncharacterized protein YcbK (DUF882 family)